MDFLGADFGYKLFLVLAPFLGPFIVSLLNAAIGKEIPPFWSRVNSQSLGQAVVVVAAAFLVRGKENGAVSDGELGAIAFGLALVAIVMILFQTLIDRYLERTTNKHVAKVLTDQVQWRDDVDPAFVMQIAQAMVDVDYFPKSLINSASDMPREKRRQLVIELVKRYLMGKAKQSLLV